MKGRRCEDVQAVWDGPPGGYCPTFDTEGEVEALWFKLPSGSHGRIAAIGYGQNDEPEWTITVEADGSVTVDPSIHQLPIEGNHPVPEWHGFLKSGEWS